ncbi:chondroitin sulfate N-acetylgalactosaminyltransferase 2 [Nilaparvata lugens]|uniref:chondroitin sulfate N-acetylgalactosaminyltransferase 2 n=1 Tax=Nilaparvata lugens TaxID=108931 RepID=UPI00193D7552|nr:chondroitin sulfate N-acetylgalactosaminyltransferase 2 [Nilaparvata lugens]
MLRLLTRVWLLALSLSLVSLLLIGRCGVQDVQTGDKADYAALLEQREEETKSEVLRLTEQIRDLKLRLLHLSGMQQDNSSECASYMRRQVDAAEVDHGLPLNNEYELIPFNHFTLNRIYPIELGLGKRVVEKPIGFKRRDLSEAVSAAVEALNRNSSAQTQRYTTDDFSEGTYRTEPTTGTQYELYFKSKERRTTSFVKVSLMRPFARLVPVSMTALLREKELVHVILPLAGRTTDFQGFMDKFVKIALKNDRRVLLTVVYFGDAGLADTRLIMSRAAAARGHSHMRLLALNETFSRSKGLRVGAERPWQQGSDSVAGTGAGTVAGAGPESEAAPDSLLFMCDVDIVFSARFLDRCRWNAKPGRQVYYPVVFSLYNPHVVYTLQGKKVPSETDQLVISRDTGFWRDFGYGMTCQYKSDFLRVLGFDEEIVGWGGEDLSLYRKYVRSGLKVVRATDPGIFHIWHEKECVGGTPDQYRACIRTKALNEASHAQLGFLAFKDEIREVFNNNFPPKNKNQIRKPRKTKSSISITTKTERNQTAKNFTVPLKKDSIKSGGGFLKTSKEET